MVTQTVNYCFLKHKKCVESEKYTGLNENDVNKVKIAIQNGAHTYFIIFPKVSLIEKRHTIIIGPHNIKFYLKKIMFFTTIDLIRSNWRFKTFGS